MERNKDIGLARIDDAHIRAVLLYGFAHSQGIAQGEVLLERYHALGTTVVATVTCVDDNNELPSGSLKGEQSGEEEEEREYYFSKHNLLKN